MRDPKAGGSAHNGGFPGAGAGSALAEVGLAILIHPGYIDTDSLGGNHLRPTLPLWIGRRARLPVSAAAVLLVVALFLAWPSSARVAASRHGNAPDSNNADGTNTDTFIPGASLPTGVDHLVTAFEQIGSTRTQGKRCD
jgi:hypothetical protein